jgi:hypothetical protein
MTTVRPLDYCTARLTPLTCWDIENTAVIECDQPIDHPGQHHGVLDAFHTTDNQHPSEGTRLPVDITWTTP